jgi:hypothetical protein
VKKERLRDHRNHGDQRNSDVGLMLLGNPTRGITPTILLASFLLVGGIFKSVAAIAYTTWNSPDRRTCAGSLGSVDTNYEPTHYHSEHGLW